MIKIITLGLVLVLFSACHVSSPLFQSKENVAVDENVLLNFYEGKEPLLTPGDKISISIWSHNDLSIGTVNSVYTSNEGTGKWLLLDDDGNVNLPKLSRVKLSGLTVKEANYFLEKKYSEILKNPIINIRVLNHYITVLGEVNNPGRYRLDNEQLYLIEVLGLAGGLTDYSKNQTVELIRIIDNKPVKFNLDLTDITTLPEKNIILKPQDIVYVNQTKLKTLDKNLAKVSLITSIITGLAVVISVLAR